MGVTNTEKDLIMMSTESAKDKTSDELIAQLERQLATRRLLESLAKHIEKANVKVLSRHGKISPGGVGFVTLKFEGVPEFYPEDQIH